MCCLLCWWQRRCGGIIVLCAVVYLEVSVSLALTTVFSVNG